MENIEWTGVLVAALVGVLSFAVARLATRYFSRRRAAREQSAAEAAQSRQVRRANERRRK